MTKKKTETGGAEPAPKKKRAAAAKKPKVEERAANNDTPEAEERVVAPPTPERTRDQSRLALKRKVRMMYDLQRLRLQAGGRSLTRPTKPGTDEPVEIFLHEGDLAILEERTKNLRKVEREALRDVEQHLETLPFYRDVLSDKDMYRGIGPTMAGVILSEFDIHRSDTVSKMWAFAGLISTPAFRCKKCSTLLTEDDSGKERRAALELERQAAVAAVTEARNLLIAAQQVGRLHTTGDVDSEILAAQATLDQAVGKAQRLKNEVERIPLGAFVHRGKFPKTCKDPLTRDEVFASGEAQRPQKGVKLPYNAFLRVKLVGVLGPVLIKSGSSWRKVYDDYKARLQAKAWGKNDGHRHQAAIRYMVKMLLLDIHKKWRESEGLLVRAPYSEDKLGMPPHSNPIKPLPRAAKPVDDEDEDEDVVHHEADIEAEMEYLEEQ